MHPLNDALPGPYVPVRVASGALVSGRYTYEPPLCRTSVPQDFCFPLSVPLDRSCLPRIRWCGTGGFQEQGQCFFIGLSCSIPAIAFYYFFLVQRLVLWGWGHRTDRVYIILSQPCTPTTFNNNNNNKNSLKGLLAVLPTHDLCSYYRVWVSRKEDKKSTIVLRIHTLFPQETQLELMADAVGHIPPLS